MIWGSTALTETKRAYLGLFEGSVLPEFCNRERLQPTNVTTVSKQLGAEVGINPTASKRKSFP